MRLFGSTLQTCGVVLLDMPDVDAGLVHRGQDGLAETQVCLQGSFKGCGHSGPPQDRSEITL